MIASPPRFVNGKLEIGRDANGVGPAVLIADSISAGADSEDNSQNRHEGKQVQQAESESTRPCTCDRFVSGEPFVIGRDCRLCWLFHNNSRYTALWSGRQAESRVSPKQEVNIACPHRGEPTRTFSPKGCGCGGSLGVYACAVFGECVTGLGKCEGKIRDAALAEGLKICVECTYPKEGPTMLDQINTAADRCRAMGYPGGFEGRGVVIGAGGEKFFRNAWVCVSMLRWLGCTLPVQFWHLGRGEMDPAMRAAAESVGIEVIDGRAQWESLPQDARPAILNGWELKPFSVLHSPFREVLYLDADCVPVADPAYLFDEPEYLKHGSIFWPDLPPSKRKEWLPEVCWRNVGLEYRNEPDFESGQFIIDKSRCWSELQLTVWMNGRSDYFYKFVYGDKSTYHLAWRKLGRDYAMPATAAGWRRPAILQHDLQGRLIFEHCCQGKEQLAGGERIASLKHANQCVDAARVLQLAWPHRIWDRATETPEERAAGDDLANFGYRYDRIGFGARPMELRIDGTIGEGAAACEKRWSYRLLDGVPTLVIVGEAHKGSEVGMMFLSQGADRVWRGDWEYHERGPVELHPPPPSQPPRWFTCRPNTWDRDIWDCVVRDNEYRLPERFDPGDVILDVGAHIGSFAYACLERGAGVVHAVEAEPGNYATLVANLRHFGPRAVCYQAAAWRCDEPLKKVRLHLPEGHQNSGGWRVADEGQQEAIAVSFDALLEAATRNGNRVRLVKLDCEGAEWPILTTTRHLRVIDEMCGEWHLPAGEMTLEHLRSLLAAEFSEVELITTGAGTGLFWAVRAQKPSDPSA